jgi:uncharacterized BrkB/YihY/UPF0761 family membrane protein
MRDRTKEIYMYLLGAIVVFIVMAYSIALIFFTIPENNKDMVNIALGTFLGAFITVVGYYFGTSKSSADKTAMMNNQEPKKEPS